jgi:hypothetical protein
VIRDISATDAEAGKQLEEFYSQCKRYNPFRPMRTSSFVANAD